MFGKTTLLLAILIAVCAAASAVIDVNKKNIKSLLKENEGRPFMVAFTAPWCGHCKSLKPEWEKLAKANEGIISFGNVNCDDEKALASKYGVKGFPSIKIFIDGKARDYNGARDASSIQAFAVSKFKGNVKAVKDADKFIYTAEEFEHTFLVIGKKKISPLLKALSVDFGSSSAGDALFASVDANSAAGKTLAKKYSVSGSGPHVVYLGADNEAKSFSGKVSKSSLTNFIASSLGLEEFVAAETPKPKAAKVAPTKKAVKVHAGNFVESCVSSGKACIVVAAGEVKQDLADKLAERFSREKKIRVVTVSFEGNSEFFAVLGVKAAGEVAVVKGTNKSQTTAPFSVKYHSAGIDGFSPAVAAISEVLGGDMRYSRTSGLPLPAEK